MAKPEHPDAEDVFASTEAAGGLPGGRPGSDRVCALVARWLDGVSSADEVAEMETALRESSEARQVFWRQAGLHGLLYEAARVRFSEVPIGDVLPRAVGVLRDPSQLGQASDTKSPKTPGIAFAKCGQRFPWRHRWARPTLAVASMLMLLATGGVLGSLATSLAVAHVDRRLVEGPRPLVVVEEGFETPPAPAADYLPTVTDCWSGDETKVIRRVAGEPASVGSNVVVPRSGECMLQFVSGHPRGRNYPGIASEVWRFIAVDELRSLAGSEEIRVEFSAWFNSEGGTGSARPTCELRVIATELAPDGVDQRTWLKQTAVGNPDDASADGRPVAIAQTGDRLDRDPHSWQRVAAVVAVPSHARYLLLHCFVRDRGDVPYGEASQYVDDITVSVEPAVETRPARRQRQESADRATRSEKSWSMIWGGE